ncbi:MAG: hypothetical protein WAL50_07570 [Kineosporiaceae bacterium]
MWRDFPMPTALVRPSRVVEGTVGEPAETPVRPAATVMLVAEGIRVFTLRRRRSLAFAPGMLVFPGGAVEAADAELGLTCRPRLPAHLVAAVRETFEECGVLLAEPDRDRGGPQLTADAGQWEAWRQDLLAGHLELAEVLRAAGARLSADLLHPWAHWVTPAFEARRFDTLFYLARVPAGQQPRHLEGEGDQAGWVDAADAVRRHAEGLLPMLPPTLVCLEELAAASSVSELFATRRSLRPVSPWLAETEGPDGVRGQVLRVHLDGVGGGDPP